MTMTERNYPRQLAFQYLREVHDTFIQSMQNEYGDECVSMCPEQPIVSWLST